MNKSYYLFLLLLLFSCNQKSTNVTIEDSKDIATIEIKEYPDARKTLQSKDYFDSIKYVIFEETEELTFPSVEELFFVDDMIIVISRRAKSILFFDNNGKYLHKIHKHGRGHGEYLTLANVMIDEKSKQIMVYDTDTRKLLYYNLEGEYLKTVNNFSGGALISDIINLPDGSFLCYYYRYSNDNKKYPTGLWEVDSDGKFVRFLYEITEKYPSKSSDNLTFFSRLSDDIIGFTDYITTNTYHVISGKLYRRSNYKMPDKIMADYKGVDGIIEDPIRILMGYQEKDNYLLLMWALRSGYTFSSMLSKSDNNIETGISFNPLMDKYVLLAPKFIRNNKPDRLTSVTEYRDIKVFIEHPAFAEKIGDHSNLSLETTNPIVQISYIKPKK